MPFRVGRAAGSSLGRRAATTAAAALLGPFSLSSFAVTTTATGGLAFSRRRYATASWHTPAASTAARPVSFYKRLKLSVDATGDDIKAAYRARALECHPDVVDTADKAAAEVTFRAISEAYETLSDPFKRRLHDEALGIERDAHRGRPLHASTEGSAVGRRHGQSPPPPPPQQQPPARRRRSTGYSGFQPPKSAAGAGTGEGDRFSSSTGAQTWKKKWYVRGDADRAFADAFEGKSLEQILFEARQRKRREAAAAAAGASVRAQRGLKGSRDGGVGGGEGVDGPVDGQAAGHAQSVRRAMEHAAERYAEKMQKQFGHGVLRNLKAGSDIATAQGFRLPGGPLPRGPRAPPGDHIPFLPFPGQPPPEGVTAREILVTRPVGTVFDENITTPSLEELEEEERKRLLAAHPGEFHEHLREDGTRIGAMERLRRAEKSVNGLAHNMGQLYSYHRPY